MYIKVYNINFVIGWCLHNNLFDAVVAIVVVIILFIL